MRVWIDLANSPHPLLFAPVAEALEADGHSILVTVRDHAQTLALTRERWDRFACIGSESPSGRMAKAKRLAARVRALADWARRSRPDVALSHNSYSQIAAARSAGIPIVTAMDYERQPANHLAFRLATIVLVPEALPAGAIRRQGARPSKLLRYPGVKEALYVGDFKPNASVVNDLGIDRSDETVLVVVRTPPSGALYHRLENPLFVPALEAISRQPQVRCVILPRNAAERESLQTLDLSNCVIPDAAIDARALVYEADLVLGAGGTMTRESALMGIPTLSLFAGPQPAVDRWLEQSGALRRLTSVDELDALTKRDHPPRAPEALRKSGRQTLSAFVAATTEVGARSLSSRRAGERRPARS